MLSGRNAIASTRATRCFVRPVAWTVGVGLALSAPPVLAIFGGRLALPAGFVFIAASWHCRAPLRVRRRGAGFRTWVVRKLSNRRRIRQVREPGASLGRRTGHYVDVAARLVAAATHAAAPVFRAAAIIRA